MLADVPYLPGLRVYTATEVVPLWHVTERWLDAHGVSIPFWSVPWAGGMALAKWVTENPESVRGVRVVDFGAGSGLVGRCRRQCRTSRDWRRQERILMEPGPAAPGPQQ